jgi:hypothetical protein
MAGWMAALHSTLHGDFSKATLSIQHRLHNLTAIKRPHPVSFDI